MKSNSTENEKIEKKGIPKKKIVAIGIACTCLVLIAGAVFGYWRVAVHYRTRFFPNTTVNGFDCSELEASQVALMLDNQIQEYKLEVTGRLNEKGENGVLGEIGAKDIGLQYVGTLDAVEHLLAQQNSWLWIETLTNHNYSHSLVQGTGYDEEMLEKYVKQWDAFRNMEKPQDAYISEYSEEKGGYEIVSETAGTMFDIQVAIDAIKNAISLSESSVDLEEINCYETASVTADDKELNDGVNAVNTWLETKVTYDWNGREVIVNREIIREWISFDGNEPQLDEEAVAEFVHVRADELDTYGKKRNFMTTLGVELTLPSGAFGWRTDRDGEAQELIQLIYQGSSLEKEPQYINKGRQKGVNDIGSSYVEADLTNQHLYLYHQGNLVLEADFVSGNPHAAGCLTPAGVFGLTYKTTNAVLRGDDYETPVSYWMPFHGNFGMHDATWRSEFGGNIYLTNGSHGCLNLPLDKAAEIYGYLSTGFPIICYY